MTADEIVDRVRSVCSRAPFSFGEALEWGSFDRVPSMAIDEAFRIPAPTSQGSIGGFDFAEDRTDSLQIWVARKHKADFSAVRRALLRDMHSLTAAITRDAHQVSGNYGILDGGRGYSISGENPNLEFVTLRLTLPVNYELQL